MGKFSKRGSRNSLHIYKIVFLVGLSLATICLYVWIAILLQKPSEALQSIPTLVVLIPPNTLPVTVENASTILPKEKATFEQLSTASATFIPTPLPILAELSTMGPGALHENGIKFVIVNSSEQAICTIQTTEYYDPAAGVMPSFVDWLSGRSPLQPGEQSEWVLPLPDQLYHPYGFRFISCDNVVIFEDYNIEIRQDTTMIFDGFEAVYTQTPRFDEGEINLTLTNQTGFDICSYYFGVDVPPRLVGAAFQGEPGRWFNVNLPNAVSTSFVVENPGVYVVSALSCSDQFTTPYDTGFVQINLERSGEVVFMYNSYSFTQGSVAEGEQAVSKTQPNAAISIRNDKYSHHDLCYAQLRSFNENNWTDDALGDNIVVRPGETASLDVPTGFNGYMLLADCNYEFLGISNLSTGGATQLLIFPDNFMIAGALTAPDASGDIRAYLNHDGFFRDELPPGSLYINNLSDHPICNIIIESALQQTYFDNEPTFIRTPQYQLSPESCINPGLEFFTTLPSGVYQIQLFACDGSVLYADRNLSVGDGNGPATTIDYKGIVQGNIQPYLSINSRTPYCSAIFPFTDEILDGQLGEAVEKGIPLRSGVFLLILSEIDDLSRCKTLNHGRAFIINMQGNINFNLEDAMNLSSSGVLPTDGGDIHAAGDFSLLSDYEESQNRALGRQLSQVGDYYRYQGSLDAAEATYKASGQYLSSILLPRSEYPDTAFYPEANTDTLCFIDIYNKLGNLSLQQGNYQAAELYFNRAVNAFWNTGFFQSKLSIHTNLDYDITNAKNDELISALLPEDFQALYMLTLSGFGQLYEIQGRTTEALTYYNRALSLTAPLPIHQSVDQLSPTNFAGSIPVLDNFYVQKSAFSDDYFGVYTPNDPFTSMIFKTDGSLSIISRARQRILGNLASLRANYLTLSASLEMFQQALTTSDGSLAVDAPDMFAQIGSLYTENGQYDTALQWYGLSLEQYRSQGSRSGAASVLYRTGRLYSLQQHFDIAGAYFVAAMSLAHYSTKQPNEIQILSQLDYADALAQSGSSTEAIQQYKSGIQLLEQFIQTSGSSRRLVSLEEHFDTDEVYHNAAILLVNDGQVDEAFSYLERSRAIGLRSNLASIQAEGWHIGLNHVDKRLIIALEATELRVTNLQSQLDELKQRNSTSEELTTTSDALEDVQREYLQILEMIELQNGTLLVDLKNVASVYNLQSVLQADEAAIFYSVGDKNSLAILVTQNMVEPVQLAITRSQVKNYITDPRNISVLPDLYRLLFNQIAADIPTNIKHIIISPSGPIYRVPFAALQAPDGSYLIDSYVLNTIPSATVYIQLENSQPAPATNPALVMSQAHAVGLSTLNYANSEANDIAVLFGVQAISDATESDLRANVTGARILHISGHAELNPFVPLFGTIYLGKNDTDDGRLEVREIYALDLSSTELVVLSGCDTGSSGNGEDFGLFNQAFLSAGAQKVISSLWGVDDKATSVLLTAFYRARSNGEHETDSQALRSAMLQIKEMPEYSNPFFWASFVLTGLS
ncbi:MAG: CHAT domain-containing protein [Anaerolineaceae bacterium]|nr:CHAT domain-containing protein [Anaerolineaceae bacterium]